MTLAYFCVLFAALLPYLFVSYAKMSSTYLFKGGNKAPRNYGESLSGSKKRAYWAHLNGFEAFPAFAAAVIIASLVGGAQRSIDLLSVSFIVCRILYGIFYILDWDKWRSLAWAGGFGSVGFLFAIAALV